MSDEADHDSLETTLLVEAPVGRNGDCNDSDVDEGEVEQGHEVEKNDAKADEHVLPQVGIALVQGRSQRSSGLECLGLSTEPLGENEGSNDAKGNIGRHPELVTGSTLTSVVAGRNEKGEFANSVGQSRGKAGPDEPVQLVLVGVGHELLTPQKNDRDSKERGREKDGIQTECGVEESRETLGKSHLLDRIAPSTKLELEGRINGTNGPTGTLLEMTTIVLGNSAKLERLVNVCSLPSLSEHQSRSCDILGQRTKGEIANFFESLASNDITGAGTPRDIHRILDWLNNMHEKVETLRERIRRRGIVEKLGRASKGHLGVHQ